MIEYNPKPGCWTCDCPVRNGEFMICQITRSNCPKSIENKESGNYTFDLPDDCPAKGVIIVRTKGDVEPI